MHGGEGQDQLDGGAGNDILVVGLGNDNIRGGANDDLIVGGAGLDVISGGLGNDTISGGDGSDTYIFNSGDGVDEISDSAGDLDILRFVDLQISDVVFTKSGDDLVLSFSGGSDQVTLKNSFVSGAFTPAIEKLEFTTTGVDGGSAIDLSLVTYDSGSDTFSYSASSAVSEDVTLQNVLLEDSKGAVQALDNFYHDMQGVDLEVTEDLYSNVDYEFYNDIEWKSYKKTRGALGGMRPSMAMLERMCSMRKMEVII